MARFSLSFISIFLVLAVLTLSMPTKRDEQPASQPFSLQGTVSGLVVSEAFQTPITCTILTNETSMPPS